MAITAQNQIKVTAVDNAEHTFDTRCRGVIFTTAATSDITFLASGTAWRPGAGTWGPILDRNLAGKTIDVNTAAITVVELLGLGD